MISETTLEEGKQKTDSCRKALIQLDRASSLMTAAIALAQNGRLTGVCALRRMTERIFRLVARSGTDERKSLREPLEKLMRQTDVFHALMENQFGYLRSDAVDANKGENE